MYFVTVNIKMKYFVHLLLTDKFGLYTPVQRLADAVPKLGHIPHAELLATSLLKVFFSQVHL
jgi:hypothetical protein